MYCQATNLYLQGRWYHQLDNNLCLQTFSTHCTWCVRYPCLQSTDLESDIGPLSNFVLRLAGGRYIIYWSQLPLTFLELSLHRDWGGREK